MRVAVSLTVVWTSCPLGCGIDAVSFNVKSRGGCAATPYQKYTLSPTAGPLPTNTGYPALATRRPGAHIQLGLYPYAHSKIEIESGGRQCQRARNVVLIELMAEVVGRNLVFEHGLVASAGHQMLPLPGCILGADLVAIDASS